MLNKIRIVLLETSHSGNIGAAARAMKTMGFSELVLVSPKDFPSEQATALATKAENILESARVVNSIDEAVADCQFIFGTSGRNRLLNWPVLSPKEAVPVMQKALAERAKIAILFGTERTGMTNLQLQKCHYHISIPADPECCSLNLAQAVQVICYEIRSSLLAVERFIDKDPLANSSETEQFYQHLEKTLINIQFLDPAKPKYLMTRLRRLFQRAQLRQQEVNILRGICAAADKLK